MAEAPRERRQERRSASEEVTEVGPGIFRCELPISLPGLGHVNCYAIEDSAGFTLVDPGLPDPASFAALSARLAALGTSPERVHTVLVTHSHPDHFGGAGRLKLSHRSEVIAHEDFATLFDPHDIDLEELHPNRPRRIDASVFEDAIMGDGPIAELPERWTPWGSRLPLPSLLEIEMLRGWDPLSRRGLLTPQPNRTVADAEYLRLGNRDWQIIHTPGHTGDHICLVDLENEILLSGDHVLPTITPHISGLTKSPDALADFFAGLERVGNLKGISTVLPAHGDPFSNLKGRTEAIAAHHHERLQQIIDIGLALGTGSVVAYSHELFQERSWGPMAESETYAHLEHLRFLGRVDQSQDGDMLTYRVRTGA